MRMPDPYLPFIFLYRHSFHFTYLRSDDSLTHGGLAQHDIRPMDHGHIRTYKFISTYILEHAVFKNSKYFPAYNLSFPSNST